MHIDRSSKNIPNLFWSAQDHLCEIGSAQFPGKFLLFYSGDCGSVKVLTELGGTERLSVTFC
jgi:hypothetical protein